MKSRYSAGDDEKRGEAGRKGRKESQGERERTRDMELRGHTPVFRAYAYRMHRQLRFSSFAHQDGSVMRGSQVGW